jgi:hypothetical protein
MITKQEIEQMLALLPESTDKMRSILTWASAYADAIDEGLVPNRIYQEMKRSRDDWHHDCKASMHDTAFYRGIVGECAEMLGEECRWCDDGSVLPEGDFLAGKVPEVLKAKLEQLSFQIRQTGLATTECCQLSVRITELEAECCRLHNLWHNAEHKLTQIKALTSTEKIA